MLFNSTVFLVFFAVFAAIYFALSGRARAQNLLIVGASYLFYGWWDERFLMLLSMSAASDYIAAIGASGRRIRLRDARGAAAFLALTALASFSPSITQSWRFALLAALVVAVLAAAFFLVDRMAPKRRRKAFLTISLAFNLGVLAAFKYFGFFVDGFASLAARFGWSVDSPTLAILLPVGISFYTFQTMSYVIDAARGDVKPSRRLIDFIAYVSFFPQLVAGPIERAARLLPQFRNARGFDSERVQSGAFLFLWGLYKKTVIADNVGKFADAAFAADAGASPAFLALGVLSFSIQIFCDFSGYSDMARGLARILGFDLMVNFNLPYFSRTPSEFWRRWHISLSTWLRDYLYVPLGGNRRGGIITCRNLFLTMLLGGLWHGAAWTFIAWGAFHGVILIFYRLARIDALLDRLSPHRAAGFAAHGTALIVMSVLTLVGWTFFRAETIADATHIIGAIAKAALEGSLFGAIARLPEWPQFLYFAGPLLLVQCARRFAPAPLDEIATGAFAHHKAARFARFNAGLAMLLLVIVLPAEGQQSFIYFDF